MNETTTSRAVDERACVRAAGVAAVAAIGLSTLAASGGTSGRKAPTRFETGTQGGGPGVESDFYSLHPFGSARISDNTELFARVEYYNTEIYGAAGAFAGVKCTFGLFDGDTRGDAL